VENGQLLIRPYQAGDEAEVIDLWLATGLYAPHNNPAEDIRRKVAFQPNLFLVGLLEDRIIATCMAGYDGHRGWINYLGVHPDHQRKGLAARIMTEAEQKLRAMGCPKINLQVREINQAAMKFYPKIGFSADHVFSFGKRLVDDPVYEQGESFEKDSP
jgi:ribosomal protein S18 acetylase RimI-like enzyme